jgi:predicted GIY-YIG superfamily endonuclease
MPFWTYLLISDRGLFYIGQTNDLDRRLAQHNARQKSHSITYRTGTSWKLIDAVEFSTREEALVHEKRSKRPEAKLAWVQKNAERIKQIVNENKFRFPKELRHPDAQRYRTWR